MTANHAYRRNRSVSVQIRVFLVLTLVVSFGAVVEWPFTPSAEACPFTFLDSSGTWRVADCSGEDQGGDPGSPGGGGGGGDGGPICWVVWGHDNEGGEATHSSILRTWFPGGVPEHVTWWWDQCRDPSCNVPTGSVLDCVVDGYVDPIGLYYTEPIDLAPGEPMEAWLLPRVWAVIEGQLQPPDVQLVPPPGDPAIVHVPTFVAVEDPQEAVTASECAPAPRSSPCVSIEAVPTLYFDPGDGSGAIECGPEGTSYDEGSDAAAQAGAPGACAHIYDQHTSSDGGYPVRVYTEWSATWQSTNSDGDVIVSGEFDEIVLEAEDVPPRVVDEVQTTVDDVQLGENAQ